MVPKHVRSTVLISSRIALETTGLIEPFEKQLSAEDRGRLREAIAGVWLPMTLAEAHYRACDALGLSTADKVAMGRKTGARVNGTLLGTIARLAHSAGVTPWTLLEQLPRFWSRGFDGGEVYFEKLGPKEARVVVADQPLMKFGYFRYGLAGTAEEQLRPFCARAYVRVERHEREGTTFYRYQWA